MDDREKWHAAPGYPDLDGEELITAIAVIGNPPTLTISDLPDQGRYIKYLKSKRGRRAASRVFWRAGYEALNNPNNKEGMWRVNGKNVRVYKKRNT